MLDTSANTSFSKALPGLQLAIDSTSLGEFKTCPRKYFYSIVLGWEPRETSVHLTFGLHMHGGIERYHHAKARGQAHEEAILDALHWALRETWNVELKRPWMSGDSYKNRLTLVRTLVWYLDQYGDNDALETIILANGKPAVELSFSFDSQYRYEVTGESVTFCGHLDRLATMNGVPYIPDVKTTKSELSPYFWQQFNPSNQFGMYMLAGQVAFSTPVRGIIVDGAQVLVNSSRFARQPITYDKAKVQEWYVDAGFYIGQMEACAKQGYWPQNDKSCNQYGGCPFLSVCSRSPGVREQWLSAEFKKRIWDPLLRRGDV